jgi:ribosomal protein L11 methyltransferase
MGGGGAGMIRLAVRVDRAHAESVLHELMELSPGGLEECDIDTHTVEYALYGAPGELPELPELRAAAGDALVEVSTSEVADVDWRDHHPPVDVGPVRVRAPWIEPREGAIDVVIDPGQAFGTGQHDTTRLCLQYLLELAPRDLGAGRAGTPGNGGDPGPLADWGCGSGVLAVTAALLGFAPVTACDVEAASVEATQATAQAHGVAVETTRCDLRRVPAPYAPTVTANLVRPLLLEVATHLERPPERLIASGLLHDEVDGIVAAFARHGLREASRRHSAEWAAVLLTR